MTRRSPRIHRLLARFEERVWREHLHRVHEGHYVDYGAPEHGLKVR